MNNDNHPSISAQTSVRVALGIVLILVVVPFVLTGVPAIVGAKESYVVLSGSMAAEPEPIIEPGDVVVVDGVDPAAIEQGDIITYQSGDSQPITHRVIEVQREGGAPAFRTQGDANEDADASVVGPDRVIGEVLFVIPYVGHVVIFANTPQGFVLLVLLPLGLLLLSEAWNVISPERSPTDSGTGDPSMASSIDAQPATPVSAPESADTTETDPDGSNSDGGTDDGPATVTVRRNHLEWAMIALAPVAIASGYLAYDLQSAWAITLTYASTGLLLASAIVYYRMGDESGGASATSEPGSRGPGDAPAAASGEPARTGTSTPTPAPNGSATNRIVTGSIESGLEVTDRLVVDVDSPTTLVRMAADRGTWVVRDVDNEGYYLSIDEAVFRSDLPDDAANLEIPGTDAAESDPTEPPESVSSDEDPITGEPDPAHHAVPEDPTAANGGRPGAGDGGSRPAPVASDDVEQSVGDPGAAAAAADAPDGTPGFDDDGQPDSDDSADGSASPGEPREREMGER